MTRCRTSRFAVQHGSETGKNKTAKLHVCLSRFALNESSGSRKAGQCQAGSYSLWPRLGTLPVTAWPVADTVLIP